MAMKQISHGAGPKASVEAVSVYHDTRLEQNDKIKISIFIRFDGRCQKNSIELGISEKDDDFVVTRAALSSLDP